MVDYAAKTMRPDKYIVGMLLTLLPPRYREGMHLRGPALACAMLQIGLPILIVLIRFFQLAASEEASLPNSEELFLKEGGKALSLLSVAGLARFWLDPINIFLYYILFEGILRLMSALEGDQILGSLPLYAIFGVFELGRKAEHKRSLGALVADDVVRGGQNAGYDLKIYSCRPKLHWNPYMTIEFEGQFYQMVREEPWSGPRRFIYYLKKNPVGRIVVVIDHYCIDDVLKAPRDKNSLRQLTDKVTSSLEPVMEDQILRGSTRSDYDLKVYSSHPKLEWDSHATIEFENSLYEMFKEESALKPRRFVYYLRKNPAGRPTNKILPYKTANKVP